MDEKIRILQVGASNIGKGGRSTIIYNFTQCMNSEKFENDFYFEFMVPDDAYIKKIEDIQRITELEKEEIEKL